jgi:Ca2+-binding RTX toxin-like protein
MRRIATVLAMGALLVALTASGAFAAAFKGTPANDVLQGTPAMDSLNGYAGNDTLYGKGGNDALNGGLGDDKIFPGPGSDRVAATPGADYVNVAGDAAKDAVYCGTGYDTVVANQHDMVEGTPAKDVVQKGLKTACEKVALR